MTQPTAAVVQVIGAPFSMTEIVAVPRSGLVEVRELAGVLQALPTPEVTVLDVISSGPPGPPGRPGPQGTEGPPGPSGPAGALYEQTFVNPTYQWVVQHNMDTYPSVTTFDLNGEQVSATVSLPDKNTVLVDFDVPFAGKAICKA